jgi:hypothetical protein
MKSGPHVGDKADKLEAKAPTLRIILAVASATVRVSTLNS